MLILVDLNSITWFKTIKISKKKAKNGEVYFGPLSAFIVHAITGQAAIDESIAGRTLMYDLHSGGWSKFTLDLFDVPIDCLPPIKASQI